MKETIYLSIDIEADGPIPGVNSMLSLGAAAFSRSSLFPLDTFEINLLPLEEANPDWSTMTWWEGQPEAWIHATFDPIPAKEGIVKFVEWCESLNANLVFVGYPASYDFLFVYWYVMKFIGKSPFGFSALDIKSMAAGLLKMPYHELSKEAFPKEWFKGCPPHTHKALDDAIHQGLMFINMSNWNLPIG